MKSMKVLLVFVLPFLAVQAQDDLHFNVSLFIDEIASALKKFADQLKQAYDTGDKEEQLNVCQVSQSILGLLDNVVNCMNKESITRRTGTAGSCVTGDYCNNSVDSDGLKTAVDCIKQKAHQAVDTNQQLGIKRLGPIAIKCLISAVFGLVKGA